MRVDAVLQQVRQVLVIALLSLRLHGFIATVEEKVQRGTGPGLFQPYDDPFKSFGKEIVVPQTASLASWNATVVAFAAMLKLPSLVTVLTNSPLPHPDIRDTLDGGPILTYAGLVAAFLILPIAETARLPIHSCIHDEIDMIVKARVLEYLGPLLTLVPLALRADERASRAHRRAADRHFRHGAGVESALSVRRPQHFAGFSSP